VKYILFNDVNFGEGVIEKTIDFDINCEIPLIDQIDILKEDLLLVRYANNYLIDIG
jgi:hypothetical protein